MLKLQNVLGVVVLMCAWAVAQVAPQAIQNQNGVYTVPGPLSARVVNGVHSAASYPGSDWSVATNAAIAAAPSGGTVSLLGFTATQLSVAGSATIAANKPITLQMPPGKLVLNGNPGISVTADGVHLIGAASVIANQTLSNVSPTILQSGTAAVLIQAIGSSPPSNHGNSGVVIQDMELDGNGVGLIGVFHPYGGEIIIDHLRVERFVYEGLYTTSGVQHIRDCYVVDNGGDGIQFGSDGMIDGYCESTKNVGWGLHVRSSGNRFIGFQSDHNKGGGVFFDGRNTANWTANQVYRIGSKINPTVNNSGGFNFYVIACTGDCKSGASAPSNWDLPHAASVTDNHVTWGNGGSQSSISFNNDIIGGYVDDNCGSEIRIEGDPAHQAYGNIISGTWVAHAMASACAANGVYLYFALANTLSGLNTLGSVGSQKNDTGGIVLQDSGYNTVSGVVEQFWHKNSIKLENNSIGNTFGAITILNGADSTASGPDLYAVYIDKTSTNSSFSNVKIQDVRGTPYSKGISNAATGTSLSGVSESGLISSPNSFATAQISNIIGGLAFPLPDTAADGSTVLCLGCAAKAPASCTVAAPSNCVCASGSGNAYAKRLNGAWYCGGL